MATNCGLYEASPAETCRVELTHPSTVIGKNKIQRGGCDRVNPFGVRYQSCGTISVDFNAGLRVPQKRPFLGPAYFNGGCLTTWGKDSTQFPHSVPAVPSERTNRMLTELYDTPFAAHTGNDAPPACAIAKGNTYNSVLGWQTNKNTLRWESQGVGSQSTCARQ